MWKRPLRVAAADCASRNALSMGKMMGTGLVSRCIRSGRYPRSADQGQHVSQGSIIAA